MKQLLSLQKSSIIGRSILFALILILFNELTYPQVNVGDSLFQEAEYYINIGYYDSAIKTLGRLLELNPNSAEAYGLLGNAFNLQGEFEEAIKMYHKCIALDSMAFPTYMNLGNAYIDAGELDSAIAVHKFLITKDSTKADYYNDLGDAYIKKEDISQAELCFKKAIQLNPYYCLAHFNLGTIYANQKKYKEAIDELFLVRNLYSFYPSLQDQMYHIIMNSDSEFEDWVEREPNNSEAHYYYSFYLYYDNDRDDAVDELEEAIKINSQEEKYYLARAIWLWNLGEYEEALSDCQKCLEINPNSWKCHNRIAVSYSEMKDMPKAIEHLQKSVAIDSLVIQSQFALGEYYYLSKEYQKSVNAWNRSVELGHKGPLPYYDLAFGYYHLGDFNNALKNAVTAKNLDSAQNRLNGEEKEYLIWLQNELQQKINQK